MTSTKKSTIGFCRLVFKPEKNKLETFEHFKTVDAGQNAELFSLKKSTFQQQ